MVMLINQWGVRVASILGVAALCSSCASSYIPAQNSTQEMTQKMSVQEARNIVLQVAKPPVVFVDRREVATNHQIAKIYISPTQIKIIGTDNKRYNISLRDSQPQYNRNGNSWATWREFTNVYINVVQEFYADDSMNTTLWRDEQYAKRVVDALLVLKSAALKLPSPQEAEALFQEVARNYRASAVKPPLPEATHRFKVQAESAIRDKDFDAAADFYEQALSVAPWWPAGHFNRALVLSETGEFSAAIVEMKRYIALVPDASDASAAQDKIYDWERKVSTTN